MNMKININMQMLVNATTNMDTDMDIDMGIDMDTEHGNGQRHGHNYPTVISPSGQLLNRLLESISFCCHCITFLPSHLNKVSVLYGLALYLSSYKSITTE